MKLIEQAIQVINSEAPDLILLLGDYAAHLPFSKNPEIEQVASMLRKLNAPLGVFNVFGNHDWRGVDHVSAGGRPRTIWHDKFDAAGIKTLENTGISLNFRGAKIYLAGVASQMALAKKGSRSFDGYDDLSAALSKRSDEDFTILMAHEPDIFAEVPLDFDLTVSGHTHAGQVRLPGWAPYVPSRYGNKYAYGLVSKGKQHLVVSGGIGFSGLPIRFGAPPEVTFVELG